MTEQHTCIVQYTFTLRNLRFTANHMKLFNPGDREIAKLQEVETYEESQDAAHVRDEGLEGEGVFLSGVNILSYCCLNFPTFWWRQIFVIFYGKR